ncbi:hypothetical protein L917_03490 [Phytophthora nicotianae]|uniref:Uncharacterized protein n=1 Tax=Phytophthora nicotianae TaxID=4792 RepID=W2LQJ4_PHYNI|nr:hypothetical protein L915_03626 [Phytophthora nicotianae]ETL99692.1 hypothetical protein L917_03490 [Phytophthora nicotianae]
MKTQNGFNKLRLLQLALNSAIQNIQKCYRHAGGFAVMVDTSPEIAQPLNSEDIDTSR